MGWLTYNGRDILNPLDDLSFIIVTALNANMINLTVKSVHTTLLKSAAGVGSLHAKFTGMLNEIRIMSTTVRLMMIFLCEFQTFVPRGKTMLMNHGRGIV